MNSRIREKQQMLKVSWTICNLQKKNPEVRDVVEIQRLFLCEKSRGIFAGDAGGQERRTVMGFLIREGARLVVRLPQEVDHPALGHDVTVSTCQLDFALPERFQLVYIGEDGKEHRPVVIHRAILGTLDRFMAFLIEETKGAFPVWLSPVQVKILPITDKHAEYAHKLADEMRAKGIRVDVDDRNEKTGYKIREAQLSKVPYMLIVGDKEVQDNTVSVRDRKEGDLGAIPADKFIEDVVEKVKNYK